MNRFNTIIAILVLSFFPCSFSQAQALTGIAANEAVSTIVQNAEQSISNLLEDLDDVVSARSFQLRLELMFLLNEIENKGNGLIGKTFGELNNSQQLFFENVSMSISDINSMMVGGLENIDQMITHTEQVIAQLPLTETEPRIRSFGPVYVKSIENPGSTKVTFRGSFLNHGKATFALGDTFCSTLSQTDSLLEFSCANEDLVAFENVNYRSGQLVVQEEIGFFAGLFGREPSYKKYSASIVVVPTLLGSYEVQATVNTQNIQYSNRQGRWGHVNPHCRSSDSSRSSFGPQGEGWKIDVNSIGTRVTNSRRGSHRLENVSENGFQVYARARNSGNCVLGSRDARGASEGVATWREFKISPSTQVQVISRGNLEWGKDLAVNLPANLRGFRVSVKQLDGNEAVLIRAEDKKWFSVSRDGQSTALVISPKSLDSALSI